MSRAILWLALCAGACGLAVVGCVAGSRYGGGSEPAAPIATPAPAERSTRHIAVLPEVLDVGPTRLNYASLSGTPAPASTVTVEPAPPPHPVSRPTHHVVAPGETLYAIARTRLGDERRWRDIVDANPGLAPSQLKAGQRLNLPK